MLAAAVIAEARATPEALQSHPAPATSKGSLSSGGASRPPSPIGRGVHSPVRHWHTKPGLHGLGEQRSTHVPRLGPPFTLT